MNNETKSRLKKMFLAYSEELWDESADEVIHLAETVEGSTAKLGLNVTLDLSEVEIVLSIAARYAKVTKGSRTGSFDPKQLDLIPKELRKSIELGEVNITVAHSPVLAKLREQVAKGEVEIKIADRQAGVTPGSEMAAGAPEKPKAKRGRPAKKAAA